MVEPECGTLRTPVEHDPSYRKLGKIGLAEGALHGYAVPDAAKL